MTQLETISKLHPDIISHFLITGESKGIPADTQEFLLQMQWAAEIYDRGERNIDRASRLLQERIYTVQQKKLDVSTCKQRIYSALNYFSIDNNVPQKIWQNDFSNKYEDLKQLCILAKDLKTAKACLDAALECRLQASQAEEMESDFGPVFILSPEMSPEMLGFKSESMKRIAKQHNDGFYSSFIINLDIDPKEKKRLLSDAAVEAEIIESDGD
jgi:hypothetical protein